MGLIYKLTCPGGKSYIGQTIQKFQKRMYNHIHGKNYCRALKESINKYGFENFEKDIIWEGENRVLSEKEKYFIEHFNTMYPNGYNLSTGGGRGEHRSNDTIKLMTKNQRELAKHRNNGLLGFIIENKSKVDGHITSWTVKNNKCGSLGRFKNKEEALYFQECYSQDPDKYISMYSKTRRGNGKGGVYYRKDRDKWVIMPHINGKNIYLGSYNTEEEATHALNIHKEFLQQGQSL